MSTFNLKLATRNLLKSKLYSGINIIGLSVGIAAVILIYRIITFELSYNKSFTNYDKIVRVVREVKYKNSGEVHYGAGIPLPAMEVLKNTIPQFKASCKMRQNWPTITVPNPNGGAPLKKFNPEEGQHSYFVESSFFEIFNWEWLEGNPATALKDVNTIVLTKSIALKCYGDVHNAIGKYVSLDNLQPNVKVEGVINDPLPTCDFQSNSFVSYATFRAHPEYFLYSDEWGSTSSSDQFYALLDEPGHIDAVNMILEGVGKEHYKSDRAASKHFAQPLSNLHYNEDIGTAGSPALNKKKLWILGFIGFLILIMACFNFINMANAQSVSRLKEVGIRKTLGIGHGQLMYGFLFETSLLVGLSLFLGIAIAYVATSYLHYISPLPAGIQLFDGMGLIVFLIGLWVLVTFLAGLYPATILTSFQPVRIFRSDYDKGLGSGVMLRKILVILQFVIAFSLIISTVIALSQLSFIRKMNIGFNKELVYTFGYNNDSITQSKLSAFKNQLKDIPGIDLVSVSSDKPSSDNTWQSNWSMSQGKEDAPFDIALKFCDEDYQKVYDIKLLAGRWLAPSDTIREAILNRTTLTRLGIKDFNMVLGTKIRLGGVKLDLVGVSEDYQTHSAHQPIEALLMTTKKKFYSTANIKIKSSNVRETLAKVARLYDAMFPEQVFKGAFIDDEIQKFYKEDAQFSALCKGFASLAVIISCLGLFALASFTISRRIKEIGVRKVLGATTQNIIGLISKDFLILVTLAFIIAAPLSWYLMSKWLQDFV
ncbi:MAG: ABC transporter permease, partial [Saprospiraceae bacterium]